MAQEVKNAKENYERRQTITVEWIEPENAGEGETNNGRIFVSDGQVYVVQPTGHGNHATLAPGTNINRMYLDGELIKGPVEIKKGQVLEVVLPHIEPSSSLALSVASNGLQAAIAARISEGKIYGLHDAPPLEDQSLAALPIQTIQPEWFTVETIKRFLKENSIVYGYLDDAITYFSEKRPSDYVVIAKGTPSTPPKDGYIDFKIGLETEKIQTDESDIRIDYRKRFFIPSVKEGDLLAEKIAGELGIPGRKVTGEEIPVNPPREVEMVAGKGAELSTDGRYVYAIEAGRPMQKNKEIIVEPVFEVAGNVDLKQGNVTFSGDILIKGDVQPNFEVNAGRQLDIRGIVTRAKVRSRSSMIIGGNVISSKLIAASSQTPYPEIIKLYAKIIATLRKLTASVYQIKNIGGRSTGFSSDDGQFITQLIDMKFSELPLIIKRLNEVPVDPEDDLASTLKQLSETLTEKLTGYGPRKIKDVEELIKLSEQLLYLGRELEERSKYASANISIPYAQNSQIEATGKIVVTRGCYYCNIVAGEGIEIESSGFFRGGSMTLFQGEITAGAIGSPGGCKTELTIVKNGVIRAKEIYPNVQVSINMRRYTFTSPYKEVVIRLNSDGALEFEGLRMEGSTLAES